MTDGIKTILNNGRLVKILNQKQVQEVTGLSRTTIARAEANGEFPRRTAISPGRVGWFVEDIRRWLELLRANNNNEQTANS